MNYLHIIAVCDLLTEAYETVDLMTYFYHF